MKKILLTGGNGFIGKNIRESYLAQRYSIAAPSSKELNLIDTDNVDAFFAGKKYDVVIHAAAKPGHRNAKDSSNLFYTNTRMFFNLIRHAGSCGRIINMGSGAIYDMLHYHSKMKEDYFGVHVPADEHGFTKYVCAKYVENCSVDVVDLRIFGIFGKYEDYAIRFISNAICKTLFDLPVTLRQDRMFSYLWVEDLIPILEFFVENKPRFKTYNLCPDEEISLLNIAEKVVSVSGKDLPIKVAAEGMGNPYSGDNARLKAEMGDGLHFTPIDVSIERLYAWYADHKSGLQKEFLMSDK